MATARASGSANPNGLGASNLVADRREGRIRVAAQGGNRHQANHDNEGQHDGIFNGGGAVFTFDEVQDVLSKLLHGRIPLIKCDVSGPQDNPKNTWSSVDYE